MRRWLKQMAKDMGEGIFPVEELLNYSDRGGTLNNFQKNKTQYNLVKLIHPHILVHLCLLPMSP